MDDMKPEDTCAHEAPGISAAGSGDRVIIGETTQAGIPISARVMKDGLQTDIRWRRRNDNTFALECCSCGRWREVPLWDP